MWTRPVTPERRVAIGEAILRIEELVDRGDDATAAVETLNDTTGHRFGLDEFRYDCGAPDREALIEWACAPPPIRLPDVTRDELVEVVRHVLADPTDDWYIEAFERNTVMPGASGLIFNPPSELRDATAEEIVDAALAWSRNSAVTEHAIWVSSVHSHGPAGGRPAMRSSRDRPTMKNCAPSASPTDRPSGLS